MKGETLGALIVGLVLGALVTWHVGRASERFRRARHDLRVAQSGLRTLVEMVWSRGWEAVRWAGVGALVVLAVIAVATR